MSGESIRSPGGLAHIRSTIGVCPQFDVLWDDLTGEEHMLIFGNMKGFGGAAIVQQQASEKLAEVCAALPVPLLGHLAEFMWRACPEMTANEKRTDVRAHQSTAVSLSRQCM
jgi:hypothetical protein